MPPKMPRRVLLGTRAIPIRIDAERCGPDAHAIYHEGAITFHPETREDMRPVFLWHELIHAFIDRAGIELADKDEELIACAVSEAIVEVFRRNPGLLKWMAAQK
jgi:hypothetical protein